MKASRVSRPPVYDISRRRSLDPREFDRDTFDVLDALRYPTHQADGLEDPPAPVSLSIHGFPDAVGTAIDKLRTRAKLDYKPTAAAVVTLCLDHALEVLDDHPDVRALAELKAEFDRRDTADGEAEEVVAGFFRNFSMALAIPGQSTPRRQNVWVPLDIKSRLHGLADDLGVQVSTLAVLCLMLTLCTQSEVNSEQSARFAEHVMAFLRRVRLRADATDALMERLL